MASRHKTRITHVADEAPSSYKASHPKTLDI